MPSTQELVDKINEQHKQIVDELRDKNAKMQEKVQGLDRSLLDLEQKFAGERRSPGSVMQSLGEQVVSSDGFKDFVTRGATGKSAGISVRMATITTTSVVAPPDIRTDIVPLPRQRLTIRQLLGQGQTASNSIEYVRQIGFTNAAKVVTEGGDKPESAITFEAATAPVRTVAHFVPASRQALDDVRSLQSLIDSELRFGVMLAEENELLFGDGTGQHLEGIATTASAYSAPFTVQNESMLDKVLLAISQSEQSRLPVTGIVVNDLDWRRMQSLKDAEDRYLGEGPFGPILNLLWQIPVVATPTMDQDEFLVGPFRDGAMIFDRTNGPQVFMTDSHSDWFRKNLLAILMEERVALANKRPTAFVTGDFGNVT